jgi:hypothetical protein
MPVTGPIDVRPLRREKVAQAAALFARRGLLAADAAGTGEARIAAQCGSPRADAERRGVGSALLAPIAERARARGAAGWWPTPG